MICLLEDTKDTGDGLARHDTMADGRALFCRFRSDGKVHDAGRRVTGRHSSVGSPWQP